MTNENDEELEMIKRCEERRIEAAIAEHNRKVKAGLCTCYYYQGRIENYWGIWVCPDCGCE